MSTMRIATFLLACGAAVFAATPEANYENAKRAWSGKDFPAAFEQFEAALTAEPDNIQYGSEYRQAVIESARKAHPKEGAPADFDRSLKFFETLTVNHPKAANAWLNYGFSYVDKIPAAGSITQVLLANSALGHFTKSIDSKPTWIALYTRGNSYLFWPKIFNRAQLGVNDLEAAYKMQQGHPLKSFHVRVFVSLGDGYWKTDNLEKARAIWQEGLKRFPDNKALKDRLAREGDELKTYIDNVLDPSRRVDTDLREIWAK
jgi:tetratricopeptide (TPR) repeat protein